MHKRDSILINKGPTGKRFEICNSVGMKKNQLKWQLYFIGSRIGTPAAPPSRESTKHGRMCQCICRKFFVCVAAYGAFCLKLNCLFVLTENV